MTQTITVTDMSCNECERSAERALNSVDRTTNTVMIDGETDTETMTSAVEDAGYEVSG
ncbi:MAG: heavy-metal-associated domain-containing protein [Euryarchaeota archaeon]|nr:heavy-metal-associated domain-containing protein [Euryarchaeota archaeon]